MAENKDSAESKPNRHLVKTKFGMTFIARCEEIEGRVLCSDVIVLQKMPTHQGLQEALIAEESTFYLCDDYQKQDLIRMASLEEGSFQGGGEKYYRNLRSAYDEAVKKVRYQASGLTPVR